ncbi:MAG: hypothetical protein MSG64_19935 [Pyrinomonadaceae bacterium MAG19_C2-C3]|nr:hypothetical protein [Pyrinomonadaceae bacterium MAG19_C2-C3]
MRIQSYIDRRKIVYAYITKGQAGEVESMRAMFESGAEIFLTGVEAGAAANFFHHNFISPATSAVASSSEAAPVEAAPSN